MVSVTTNLSLKKGADNVRYSSVNDINLEDEAHERLSSSLVEQ